jgi:ACT domain-containing protein
MIDYETLEQVTLLGFVQSLDYDLSLSEFEQEETDTKFPVLYEEEDNVAEALYAKAFGWDR